MVQYDMASIEAEAVSLISMSGKYIALMHILQASMKASMPCCTLCFLCCNLFFALICTVNPLLSKEVAKLQHLCLTCRCFPLCLHFQILTLTRCTERGRTDEDGEAALEITAKSYSAPSFHMHSA